MAEGENLEKNLLEQMLTRCSRPEKRQHQSFSALGANRGEDAPFRTGRPGRIAPAVIYNQQRKGLSVARPLRSHCNRPLKHCSNPDIDAGGTLDLNGQRDVKACIGTVLRSMD